MPSDATSDTGVSQKPTEQIAQDNPFREVIVDLASDGHSWNEIMDRLDEAYDAVDKAAFEECKEEKPIYTVTGVVADHESTSGERYEEFEVDGEETEQGAEDWVLSRYPEVRRVTNVEQTDSVVILT